MMKEDTDTNDTILAWAIMILAVSLLIFVLAFGSLMWWESMMNYKKHVQEVTTTCLNATGESDEF